MKQLTASDIQITYTEKRDAAKNLLDFILSDRCLEGRVGVLYGLRRTGKTTVMQQIMKENEDQFSSLFLEVSSKDTMADVYARLDQALKDHVKCVFLDEITNIPDFIEESALLADIYAKEGLRIILAGTDSLSFIFAENNSLFDRTEHISTTYIPFEEHCRVLGTKDMDDYISYGGLMKKGASKDDRIVHDHHTAMKYLDDAVSDNISRSIQKLADFSNHTELSSVTAKEMRAVIEKMVEKYSGVLNPALANEALKKVVLSFPTDSLALKLLEGEELFARLRADKPQIVREFVKEINADTQIVHKFSEDMVTSLEDELIQLGFLSATNRQNFFYDAHVGWRSSPLEKEYYLIQPAVKYYHLQKALEFVQTKEYYNDLSAAGQRYVLEQLDSKVRGDMTEQIIVFEVSNALPSSRYFVCKTVFRDLHRNRSGEYDMLIYDRKKDSYTAFEIKHTNQPYSEQYKHLLNPDFQDVADRKYGDKENTCVLYNGSTFSTPQGVTYLNLSDFVEEITRRKDVAETIQHLCRDIPVKDLEQIEEDYDNSGRGDY